MTLQMRQLVKEIQALVPYFQKRHTNRIVSLTIRTLADEMQRDPYGFVVWLGRYQGTINGYIKQTKSRPFGGTYK